MSTTMQRYVGRYRDAAALAPVAISTLNGACSMCGAPLLVGAEITMKRQTGQLALAVAVRAALAAVAWSRHVVSSLEGASRNGINRTSCYLGSRSPGELFLNDRGVEAAP